MSASSVVEYEATPCDGKQAVVAVGALLNVKILVEQHGV
jgi:hypothetical protein